MNDSARITALIVEDDKVAAEALQLMLKGRDDLDIVGTAHTSREAQHLIKLTKPELLFLDIELPDKDAFTLLGEIEDKQYNPVVIFTTGHDEYMQHAIRSAAFDYLLKPIDVKELFLAIDRYLEKRLTLSLESRLTTLLEELRPVHKKCFQTRSGMIFVDPAEIFYLEADLNYTDLYYSTKRYVSLSLNLGKVLDLLPPKHFVRISRSHAVNILYLDKVNISRKQCFLSKEGEVVMLKATVRGNFKVS